MIDAERECRRLLRFARASVSPIGFRWLDARGVPDPAQPVHTWITTRMTYVYSLAHLLGEERAAELAIRGVRALADGPLRDREHGGWHAAVGADGAPVEQAKAAYAHAFVVLAASGAAASGLPGGESLLEDALTTVERHFLDAEGRVVDTRSPDLRSDERYRGANSSMHMVEAFLAAGDVTGDRVWHRRALAIAEHLVHEVARPTRYLLPEHFDRDWTPLPDYNADHPGDPFRPFGVTPGHLLEWSRLLLHLEVASTDPPAWLLEDAVGLFDKAVAMAWNADGNPGLVYTVDWDGKPVVRLRMHWVHAEGLAAASLAHRRTGQRRYARWQQEFEQYIADHLIDHDHGSWHHELDERHRPTAVIWRGKPDIYHAYQALLLTRMPLAASLPTGLARGRAR